MIWPNLAKAYQHRFATTRVAARGALEEALLPQGLLESDQQKRATFLEERLGIRHCKARHVRHGVLLLVLAPIGLLRFSETIQSANDVSSFDWFTRPSSSAGWALGSP